MIVFKNAVITASITNGIGINARNSIAKQIAVRVVAVTKNKKIVKGIIGDAT